MKKILISFAFLAFFLISLVPRAYAAATPISIEALDTVANFETQIEMAGLPAASSTRVLLKKPDNSQLAFTAVADDAGFAKIIVSADETRIAGAYHVSAANAGADFRVFSGETSAKYSGIFIDKAFVAANGSDAAKITIRITDEFGNPLSFHDVSLTSSRNSDVIIQEVSETDERGIASFLLSSTRQGVSVLTATDETSGDTLEARPKVVFFKSKLKSVGGDISLADGSFFKASALETGSTLIAQASLAARFEIDNIPASAKVNESLSFRVSAIDDSGNVVPSYAGTILFNMSDPNASAPQKYAFVTADQGRKTFDLAVSFPTAGAHKIIVYQEGNALIKGEKNIEILSAVGTGASKVIITKPAPGTYSTNVREIAGEASPSAYVKIFDNGQMIANVQANTLGRFSYTTSPLADGQHEFYAESNGIKSTSVTITIDTTPAAVADVVIKAGELGPGETTDISLRTSADVSLVQVTVDTFIDDLQPDFIEPALYRGTIKAPSTEGDYPVYVIITDKIGNTSSPIQVGMLKVSKQAGAGTPSTFSVPSKVQGVSAVPSNRRVTLRWQVAYSQAGIAFYRIYYGTNPNQLNVVVNTNDASTEWYIPNLQNGKQYFFQIVGVDTKGKESDVRSDIVSATPNSTGTDGGGPVLCDPMPCPQAGYAPNTPEDGPEVWGMIMAAALVSFVIRRKLKVKM